MEIISDIEERISSRVFNALWIANTKSVLNGQVVKMRVVHNVLCGPSIPMTNEHQRTVVWCGDGFEIDVISQKSATENLTILNDRYVAVKAVV